MSMGLHERADEGQKVAGSGYAITGPLYPRDCLFYWKEQRLRITPNLPREKWWRIDLAWLFLEMTGRIGAELGVVTIASSADALRVADMVLEHWRPEILKQFGDPEQIRKLWGKRGDEMVDALFDEDWQAYARGEKYRPGKNGKGR